MRKERGRNKRNNRDGVTYARLNSKLEVEYV